MVAISLLTFMLSVSVPGDPVELMMNGGNGDNGQSASKIAGENAFIEKRHQLGLDLPVFYCSFSNKAMPDTLYKLPKKLHKENLERFIYKYGNWPDIQSYYASIKKLENLNLEVANDSLNIEGKIGIKDNLYKLYIHDNPALIDTVFSNINNNIQKASSLAVLEPAFNDLKSNYAAVSQKATPYKRLIPSIKWYGSNNQYHHWVTKFIVGDFGISFQNGRPVSEVLWDAMRWTVMLSLLSIMLSYLIAIPIGVNSAAQKGTTQDQVTTTFLFVLYSLPSFWVATLLIMFFGGGDFFDWFPSYGVGEVSDSMSFFEVIGIRLQHLFLPLLCYTYGSLAFISRQMRGAVINSLSQDYVRTAKAKGLSGKVVLWKHAFRNSLLPIITLFANIFPLAISGSIVLEIIFSIPGMGKLAYEAILRRNYPIVFSVVMFSGILTLIGNLVSDILYAVVDPRISYSSKKK